MKRCAECNEPDYPLDDKTGLCYTCWQLAGREIALYLEEE